MIPYSTQNIDTDDITSVVDVLKGAWLTQGPAVPKFENALAELHHVDNAVAVSSATAALHICCIAMGVTKGSIVWTSPNSFVASANCALYCGATVDFVDIDPITRNMSVSQLEAKLHLAKKQDRLPDVVIPVSFAGLPVDLREIRELADQYGFRLLHDASHAVGASYQDQPIGKSYADATVFSFHPVKIITSGEGGAILTQDHELARKLLLLRSHGIERDRERMEAREPGPWCYEQHVLGYNYRMTDIQAALGVSQLGRLSEMHGARQELSDRYDKLLNDLPLVLPVKTGDRSSALHLYVVELQEALTGVSRSDLFCLLREKGVGVNVHYIPIHTQPYFRKLGFKAEDFPNSVSFYNRAISLPIFPNLQFSTQDFIVDVLESALRP